MAASPRRRAPTPTIHLYAGDAAREPDGSVQTGSGAIDHVSVVCQGYGEFRARFETFGLPYRENVVPATPLWQLFVYDPNGVQLELTFHAGRRARAAAGRSPPAAPVPGARALVPAPESVPSSSPRRV